MRRQVFGAEMPPKAKRLTRRQAKASTSSAELLQSYLQLAGIKGKVVEIRCDSGDEDDSRVEPDEEERLFVDKDKSKWPKIVEEAKDRLLECPAEQYQARLKLIASANRQSCTEIVKSAAKHLLCFKKWGYYFTATPGRYVSVHWTDGDAFAKILGHLETVPDVLLSVLVGISNRDERVRKLKVAFAANYGVEHNMLADLSKNLIAFHKEYKARYVLRRKLGEESRILILGKTGQTVLPVDYSKWFAMVMPWLNDCQQVWFMCKMGAKAVELSLANRGKRTVRSEKFWRRKMHIYKLSLTAELVDGAAEKLDKLLIVFTQGTAYKIKYGRVFGEETPRFYLQLDALCSSKKELLPDVRLNEEGLCDKITSRRLPVKDNCVSLKAVLDLELGQVGKNIFCQFHLCDNGSLQKRRKGPYKISAFG